MITTIVVLLVALIMLIAGVQSWSDQQAQLRGPVITMYIVHEVVQMNQDGTLMMFCPVYDDIEIAKRDWPNALIEVIEVPAKKFHGNAYL